MNRAFLEGAPSPLSRAYRLMYDRPDLEGSYLAISTFFEPLIKWYGAVGLVCLRKAAMERLTSSGILAQFRKPSLGTWTQIVRLALQDRHGWDGSPVTALFEQLERRCPDGVRACASAVEKYLGTSLEKRTVLDFLECGVAYRNKTRGHGAPSAAHQKEFSHQLLAAFEELVARLDGLCLLKLGYVERSENVGGSAQHILRVCSGLNSFVHPERLLLEKENALSSGTVHLCTEDLQPLVELSPIVVRPEGTDSFYFLNDSARGPEYLCYDGVTAEFYRSDGLGDAVRQFLLFEKPPEPKPHETHRRPPPTRPRERDDELPFDGL